jgi:hypothetical protein
MRIFLKSLAVSALLITLTGCSVFYPNWGATGLPEPVTESETIAPEETAATEETTEAEATPEETQTPEETKEPIVRKEVTVEIIMAVPEPAIGVFTVVAQIPNMTESGGKCIFKYLGNGVTKTKEVKAEPSSEYTQCFPIEFPLKDLPSGNGVVTVSYESEGHFGTSAPTSVGIG